MINKPNFYWPIYKNLEKEVLELTNSVHFCDSQVDVFSLKVAELLIRCVVEIESLSKALYKQEGGDMNPKDAHGNERYVNYDFDCLKFLDIKWKLSQKKVFVSCAYMYFDKDENKELMPLKNAHKGEAEWQKVYQSVKHNRVESFTTSQKKPTVKCIVRAMAALYLLNVYFRDEQSNGHGMFKDKEFDYSLGSILFSVHAGLYFFENQLKGIDSTGLDDGAKHHTYIFYFPDYYMKQMQLKLKEISDDQFRQLTKTKEYIDFVNSGGDFSDCKEMFFIVEKVAKKTYGESEQVHDFLVRYAKPYMERSQRVIHVDCSLSLTLNKGQKISANMECLKT